jgi:UDP-N-acetylmuramate--alanine ligase
VHFVGIGGSGMSGIARLVLGDGHRVTGSDVRDSANIARAARARCRGRDRHDAANVADDVDTLVVTGALWQDNPEYQLALQRGCPCCTGRRRSRALIAGRASSRSRARTARPPRPA